ncbi:MAG: SGNH/GDSL hydrolase family protein [Planctomycetes bacterium]|nr:SGNH/GDSL hydrolase family protein [Planctomycetota bacterium]
MKRIPLRARIALLAGATLVSLLLAEVVLRRVACREAGVDDFESVRQRYLGVPLAMFALQEAGWRDHSSLVPGTYQDGKIHVNSLGARGLEVRREKADATTRIVCLGGSAVFGTRNSDDDTTWPARLQEIARAAGKKAEVINGGVPAFRTDECVYRFEHRFLNIAPDVAVLYSVHNTILERRILRLTYDPRAEAPVTVHDRLEELLSCSALYLRVAALLTDRSKAEKLEEAIASADQAPAAEDIWNQEAINAALARERREQTPAQVGQAPYFTAADLADHEAVLKRFTALCRGAGTVPVLCTKALAYRLDCGPEEFLRSGGMLRRYMPDYGRMRAVFEAYNDLIRRTAAAEGAVLFDADLAMSRAPEHWADWVHMNDAGCQVFAALLERRLEEAGVLAAE